MNTRRAANRTKRLGVRMESHAAMKGRKIPGREPEHHEIGGSYTHKPVAPSRGSSRASIGPGPLPGAGQLPPRQPGHMAGKVASHGIDSAGITPVKGMKP